MALSVSKFSLYTSNNNKEYQGTGPFVTIFYRMFTSVLWYLDVRGKPLNPVNYEVGPPLIGTSIVILAQTTDAQWDRDLANLEPKSTT